MTSIATSETRQKGTVVGDERDLGLPLWNLHRFQHSLDQTPVINNNGHESNQVGTESTICTVRTCLCCETETCGTSTATKTVANTYPLSNQVPQKTKTFLGVVSQKDP